MISGIFGLPGSGKSLYLSMLAERAINGKNFNFSNQRMSMFKKYDKVYTNFPFDGAYKIEWDKLGHVYLENCCLLIDEIMMFADSRDFKNFPESHKFFFSQHRKFNIDIVFASQSYSDCDLKIRQLCDSFYYVARWYGNYSVVKPIRATFDIKGGQIINAYTYGSNFEYYFFNRKKLYNLGNTNYIITDKRDPLEDYIEIPWSAFDERNYIENTY